MRESATALSSVLVTDHGICLNVYSQLAGVLKDKEIIDERDLESFRMVLAELHPSTTSTPLDDVLWKKSEKLSSLIHIYLGVESTKTLLLSSHVKVFVGELMATLQGWKSELIHLSRLHFNQVIPIRGSYGANKLVLSASIYVDLAQMCEDFLARFQSMNRVRISLDPASWSNTFTEKDLKNSFDADVQYGTFHPERKYLSDLADFISEIGKLWSHFESTMKLLPTQEQSPLPVSHVRLIAKAEYLTFLCKKHLTSGATNGRDRIDIVSGLDELCQMIDENLVSLRTVFKGAPQPPTNQGLYESEFRFLEADLIRKGISPEVALLGAKDISSYLVKNNLTPEKLISQELKKIHPALDQIDFEGFQQFSAEHRRGSTSLKGALLSKIGTMTSGLRGVASEAAKLLFFTIFFAGCGVKKAPTPISEVIRPAIPFERVPAAPESNSQDPAAAKQIRPLPSSSSPSSEQPPK